MTLASTQVPVIEQAGVAVLILGALGSSLLGLALVSRVFWRLSAALFAVAVVLLFVFAAKAR